ncbi:hypothetical protein [Streptomyces sp. ME19-01-6]|uniref:hypothetical protein n=1 Tax=Streptomyces sp. ME19-01-6 TaxID=3028686 RepID=UPI0029AE79D5|nr:hypothetical protein [Streptomyces sp. ME19-01-6]MDX3231862.1 hypothetical protein [Streptomyces sp. ME19-01-6]
MGFPELLATWRYGLRPAAELPNRTVVRQSFTHGPGDSGLRCGPIQSIPRRSCGASVRRNMTTSIEGMVRDVKGRGT